MLCPANTNSSYSRCGRRRCCRSSRPTATRTKLWQSVQLVRQKSSAVSLDVLLPRVAQPPPHDARHAKPPPLWWLQPGQPCFGTWLLNRWWPQREQVQLHECVGCGGRAPGEREMRHARVSACVPPAGAVVRAAVRAREGGASVTRSCARARDHHGKARVCNNERHTIMRLKTRMRGAHARGFGRRQI